MQTENQTAKGTRRHWYGALLGALCLHAGLALWSGRSPAASSSLATQTAHPLSALSVDLTPFDDGRELSAKAGGGSVAPGQAEQGQQQGRPEVKPKLGFGLDLASTVVPLAPAPGAGASVAPDADERALFELNDQDLASAFELLGAPTLAVRAVPARHTRLASTAGAPAGPEARTMLGHYLGTRAGTGAGPGGAGAGLGGSVFGGRSGPFRAEVCFLDPGRESLREFPPCRPSLSLRTTTINVPPQSFARGFPGIPERTEWFSIRFTGEFHVQTPGRHNFRLVSDDGSMLFIDRQLVIDNDGHHGPLSRANSVPLAAGKHHFELDYYQGPRDMLALQLFVTAPEGIEQLFGPSL